MVDRVGSVILGLNPERALIRVDLRKVGENGIPGGAVECADIRRNTSGEGDHLD